MKTTWTCTLTVKQALSICGSLSNPGKMPGHGYALPAYRCRLGLFLQQLPKTVCFHCYALRGRYMFPTVKAAMEKRLKSLTHPVWIDAVTTLIYRSKDRHFRWHDSGDLQSIEHLRNIIRVCKNLPRVKFWLPTREYQTVEAYRRMGGRIPSNLCIRLSAHLIDGKLPLGYGLPVRTVSSQNTGSRSEAHVCPAPKQNNQCGTCRLLEPIGQDRELQAEVGQAHFSRGHAVRRPWPMRFLSNLIKLAAMLSRGKEGRCFSCARMFTRSTTKHRAADQRASGP